MKIVLASKSPRRKELLALLINDFEQFNADIDETAKPSESAQQLVARLALEKAKCAQQSFNDALCIGSDTVIELEGDILTKPDSDNDAIAMIERLQGNTHSVYTSVAVVHENKQKCVVDHSRVTFSALTKSEIEQYVALGESSDKAGAYGIQGYAAGFIEQISGNFHSIMGLPVAQLRQLLNEFEVDYWRF